MIGSSTISNVIDGYFMSCLQNHTTIFLALALKSSRWNKILTQAEELSTNKKTKQITTNFDENDDILQIKNNPTRPGLQNSSYKSRKVETVLKWSLIFARYLYMTQIYQEINVPVGNDQQL